MKFELKSISYWSAIKVSFVVNLLLGLVMGFFFAIFSGIVLSLMDSVYGTIGISLPELESPPIALLIILYPILFGFGGAVFNTMFVVIAVFIYNIVGKFIGGLELEMSEIRLQAMPVAQTASYAQHQAAFVPSPPPPPPPMQPLPPDMTPPENNTDEGNPPPRSDGSFQ